MSLRHKLIFFVVFALLSACGAPTLHHDGMGGTGQIAGNDGMGGTGQVASGEDGIGGTGIVADGSGIGGTGIVGEVTGFGSIFVNGLEIELNEYSRLSINNQATRSHEIAIGEMVEIQAQTINDETLARRVNIRYEVVGPVDSIDNHRSTITVLGQEILTKNKNVHQPELGEMVQVSGLRDANGIIHSSRITTTQSNKLWLIGKIGAISANSITIGNATVNVKKPQQYKVGSPVRVRATYQKGRIVASQVIVGANPFTQHINRMIVQGFIHQANSNRYLIASTVFSSRSSRLRSQLDNHQGQWLRVELIRTNTGLWQVEQVLSKDNLPRGRSIPRPDYNSNRSRRTVTHRQKTSTGSSRSVKQSGASTAPVQKPMSGGGMGNSNTGSGGGGMRDRMQNHRMRFNNRK